MYANLYIKIAEKLDLELNKEEVTAIHGKLEFIARFNNQFTSDNKELAMPEPAILIQFIDTDWTTKSRGVQKGDSIIIIHVGINSIADDNFYSDNKEKALLIDAYMDLVHTALQGFQAPCIGSLDRKGSGEDPDHDDKFVQTLTYTSTITDNTASKSQQLEEKTVTLEVTGQTEITIEKKESPYIIPM